MLRKSRNQVIVEHDAAPKKLEWIDELRETVHNLQLPDTPFRVNMLDVMWPLQIHAPFF